MKHHVNSCRLPACGSRKSSYTLRCLTQTLPLLLRLSAGADGVTAPPASPGNTRPGPASHRQVSAALQALRSQGTPLGSEVPYKGSLTSKDTAPWDKSSLGGCIQVMSCCYPMLSTGWPWFPRPRSPRPLDLEAVNEPSWEERQEQKGQRVTNSTSISCQEHSLLGPGPAPLPTLARGPESHLTSSSTPSQPDCLRGLEMTYTGLSSPCCPLPPPTPEESVCTAPRTLLSLPSTSFGSILQAGLHEGSRDHPSRVPSALRTPWTPTVTEKLLEVVQCHSTQSSGTPGPAGAGTPAPDSLSLLRQELANLSSSL